MSGRVDGKIALITGAGSGLGRASALHLAREGANVLATDLNQDTAAETARMINGERQGAAISAAHDATKEGHWKSALELVKDHFGGLNVLLNNAGISIGGDIESTDFETWKKLQEVDVDSVFWGCKLAIPYLRDSGGGSIINISSTVGILGNPLTLAYGTAKAGLERFTWGLAAELGQYNVAVNVLKPLGPVLTEGFQAQRPDADFSTWPTPEAMAKAAVFLAKQDARGLSGAIVTDEEIVKRLGL